MEACKVIGLLGRINSQNAFEECPFAFFKLLFYLLFAEVWIHSNIVLGKHWKTSQCLAEEVRMVRD